MSYSMKSVAAILFAIIGLAAMAAPISYTETQTISEPLELTENTEISVADGVTVTYEGQITAAEGVTISKTGAGTLILKNENNSFGDNLKIAEGFLEAQVQGCLGTQTLTLDGGQLRFNLNNATFSNPIVLASDYKGPNILNVDDDKIYAYNKLQIYFDKSATVTFTGGITGEGYRLRMGGYRNNITYADPTWVTVTLDCEVNMGASGTVGFHDNGPYGTFKFMKKVTCAHFDTGTAHSAKARIEFHAENAIGKYTQCSTMLYMYNANALKGAEYYNNYCWNHGRGTMYVASPEVAVNLGFFTAHTSRTGSDSYPSGSTKTGATITGSFPYTVYVNGPAKSANPVSYVRFRDAATLVQDVPDATAESFVQTYDWVPSTMTGAIIIKTGTMRVTNGAGFPNATALEIAEGAALDFRSTAVNMLVGVKKITLNGSLAVAASSGIAFRDDGELELELGENAALSYGQNLIVKKLTVNGVTQSSGNYTSQHFSQLTEGSQITVLAAGESIVGYNWTGAGANEAITTPENWDLNTVTDILNSGMLIPVFARGGTRAEISGAAYFHGIKFDSSSDFVCEGMEGSSLKLSQSGVVTVEPETGTRNYTIKDLPMELLSTLNCDVAANTTLTIDNSLNNVGVQGIQMSGSGSLVLEGTNRFNGALNHPSTTLSDLVLRGLISSSSGEDQGAAEFGGGKTITCYVPYSDRQDKTSRLRLENAIIEKPLAAEFIIAQSDDRFATLTCGEATTNVISGYFHAGGQNCFIGMEKDSKLTLSGPVNTKTITMSAYSSSSGVIVYSNFTATASSSQNVYMRGGTSYFYGNGTWRVGARFNCDGGKGVMMNDNVFVPSDTCPIVLGNWWGSAGSPGELDFNGTRQTFPYLRAEKANQTLTTPDNKPAVLAITGKSVASTNTAQFIGPVTIEKSGEKAFYTIKCKVLTTGNLIVSGGVFDIDKDSAYPNVPLAEFSGTATLALHANDQLSRDVVLKVKDTAVIDVPEGVMQTVRELWMDDMARPLPSGIYGGADCAVEGAKKTYAAHFRGAGAVKVKRGGTTLYIR